MCILQPRRRAACDLFAPQIVCAASRDRGKRSWTPGGLPSVGCTSSEVTHRFYNHAYRGATYFSLPGRCSFLDYTEKDDERCRNTTDESEGSRLGGECATAKQVGSRGCTWHAEPLGEVSGACGDREWRA